MRSAPEKRDYSKASPTTKPATKKKTASRCAVQRWPHYPGLVPSGRIPKRSDNHGDPGILKRDSHTDGGQARATNTETSGSVGRF